MGIYIQYLTQFYSDLVWRKLRKHHWCFVHHWHTLSC